MPTLWFTKIKLGYNELSEVPDRYYKEVLAKLVAAGLYDTDGNEIVKEGE